MNSLRKMHETHVSKIRTAETRTNDLKLFLKEQLIAGMFCTLFHSVQVLDGHVSSELRVENKRDQQRRAEEEAHILHHHTAVTSQTLLNEARLAEQKEEDEAENAAFLIREKIRTDLIKRRVCEQDEELKALKRKLNGVLLNRERAAQLMEKDHRDTMSKMAEAELDESVFQALEKDNDKEINESAARSRLREEAKAAQLMQIAAREDIRNQSRLEYEKERAQMNELSESIRMEQYKAHELKQAKAVAIKADLHAYMKERSNLRVNRIEAEKLEIEAIRRFNHDILERENRLSKERSDRKKEKERIFESISVQINDKRELEKELTNLRNEIYMEELDATKRRNERLEAEKHVRNKLELLHNYDMQLEEKRMKISAAKFEQEKVKQDLLEEYIKNEKIEQLNDQKRRAKILAFNKELVFLIETKKQMHLEEQARDEQKQNAQDEFIKQQHLIVQEERTRILHEYQQYVGENPKPQNSELLRKGTQIQKARDIEKRLSDALSKLREHVSTNNDENSSSIYRDLNETDNLDSARSSSIYRTRELNKRLLASRTREAELQDEVDSLKSTIQEQDSRMSELDKKVSELTARYTKEQHRYQVSRSELFGKMGELKSELSDDEMKFRNTIKAKDAEIESLKLKLSQHQQVSEHHNRATSRQRPHSSMSVLPSVTDYFKTSISPPRPRPIPVPRLVMW